MSKTKKVFVAYVNDDLTEGKGYNYPLAVCESKHTAMRMGKGKNVQGSNAIIKEHEAIYHNGNWCAPVRIFLPNIEDKEKDKKEKIRSDKIRAAEEAMEKARKAGLSEADIKALKTIVEGV